MVRVKISESDARKSWRTLRAVAWVGVLAGLAGVGWSGYMVKETAKTADWPSVQGTIVQCVAVPGSGKKTKFTAEIAYSYTVNGQKLTGTQIRQRNNSVGDESEAQAFVDNHPIGGPVTVFYDPAHESVAYLEVGVDKMFLLVGGGTIVVLVLSIIMAIYYRKEPPPPAEPDEPTGSATQPPTTD